MSMTVIVVRFLVFFAIIAQDIVILIVNEAEVINIIFFTLVIELAFFQLITIVFLIGFRATQIKTTTTVCICYRVVRLRR